jgi:hypothetical protein
MAEALLALEDAGLCRIPEHEVARLEQIYAHELAIYELLLALRNHVAVRPLCVVRTLCSHMGAQASSTPDGQVRE